MQLVCVHCTTTNRVPDERLDQRPKCGRCKRELLDGSVAVLTQNNFEKFVQHNDIPVLVDFWAAWCGPCKIMAPIFAQVAQQMATDFRFAKVDTEAEPTLAQRFQIRSIPSLILFKNGMENDRIAGAMDAQNLRRWLTQH